jgi:hypothetical protein
MLHRNPEAGWPTQQDIEGALKMLGPHATEQDIRDILKMLDPPGAARTECLHRVIDDIQRIAGAILPDSPGEVRKQFAAIGTAAEKLHTRMLRLPDHRRRGLLATSDAKFLDDLAQLKKRCSDRVGEKRPSGGERIVSAKLIVAAVLAIELLQQFGRRPAGKRFYTLTSLLLKAATGETRDCKNMCVEILRGRRQK